MSPEEITTYVAAIIKKSCASCVTTDDCMCPKVVGELEKTVGDVDTLNAICVEWKTTTRSV